MVTINGKTYQDYTYLQCVDVKSNHNKFYEAFYNQDGSIQVYYGREGATRVDHYYSRYEKDYYDLIQSKKNKGYKDITFTKIEQDKSSLPQAANMDYAPIEDEKVQKFLDFIEQSRDTHIKNTYKSGFSDKPITKQFIEELDDLLTDLRQLIDNNSPIWRVNEKLVEIFTIAPRRTIYELAPDADKYVLEKTYEKEYNNYEILKAKYDKLELDRKMSSQQTPNTNTNKPTLLDAMGITMRPVTFKEEQEIRKLLQFGEDKSRCYLAAYRVENNKTRQAYDNNASKLHSTGKHKLLFHGSGNGNWSSILQKGLIVNADALGLARGTGKGLGNGLYFGDDINKSFSYTQNDNNGRAIVGIYDVELGKCKDVNEYYVSSTDIKNNDSTYLDGKKYKRNHSWHSGNSEYCIYKSEQCTVKYVLLCQYERVREKEMRFKLNVDFLFQQPETKDKKITAELRLTDTSKYALKNISNTALIKSCKMEYDIDKEKFHLYIDDKEYDLKQEELKVISHDFMQAGWESENDFYKYIKDYKEALKQKTMPKKEAPKTTETPKKEAETKSDIKTNGQTLELLKPNTEASKDTPKDTSSKTTTTNTTQSLDTPDGYDLSKIAVSKDEDFDLEEIEL